MFDSKSILETLRSGNLSAEEIAQSFADALNEANASYMAEQEAAKKAETEKAEKLSSLQTILDSFNAWLNTYYGNHSDGLKAEDVLELFDFSQNFSSHLETWRDGLHTTIDNLKGKVTKKSEKYDSCDEALEAFFKEFGLF